MKAFVFVCLALCLVNLVRTEDNGSYRPELYGDKYGAYNRGYDGRFNYGYKNYFNRNNVYYPNYGYQPLYQQLAPPVVTYRDNSIIPSSTIRPVVVLSSTASPTKYVYPKNYGNEGYARIIEQDSDSNANSYQYRYKTENGISAAESGVVDAHSAGGTRVSGFYEYVGTDGLTYRVDYTADENGFHPSGAHLP